MTQRDSNPWPLRCRCSALTNWATSYEVTQLRAGQFVGLMFSRERNVVWKNCYMKCVVWNQMKMWSFVINQQAIKNIPWTFKNLLTSALPKFFIHLWGTGVQYKWRVSQLLCFFPGISLHLGMGWIMLCLLWNLSQSYGEPVFVSHNNWSKLLDLMFSLKCDKNVIL